MLGCRHLSRVMTFDTSLQILARSNVTLSCFQTPEHVTIKHFKLVGVSPWRPVSWFRFEIGVTGFEPATSWSQTTRSTKLSYTPIN